jgi:pimeloyl-ACP methyl ester carboxylesterase
VPPAVFAGPIAGALADGHLASFDELGHFGPLEDPARMAAAVLEAFAGID